MAVVAYRGVCFDQSLGDFRYFGKVLGFSSRCDSTENEMT